MVRSSALLILAATAVTLAAAAAPPRRPAARKPVPAGIAAGGFRLVSAAITLPDDPATFPAGPNVDTVNANCLACHSASMVLFQPALPAAAWQAEVTKMREVYHAPVDPADVPAIVAYLAALPKPQAPTGRAQDPDPKVAPDVSGRPARE